MGMSAVAVAFAADILAWMRRLRQHNNCRQR